MMTCALHKPYTSSFLTIISDYVSAIFVVIICIVLFLPCHAQDTGTDIRSVLLGAFVARLCKCASVCKAALSVGNLLTKRLIFVRNDSEDCLYRVSVNNDVLLFTAFIRRSDFVEPAMRIMHILRFFLSVLVLGLFFFVRYERRRPCTIPLS